MSKRPYTSTGTDAQKEADTSMGSKQTRALDETVVVLTRPDAETDTIRLRLQEVDKLTATSRVRSSPHIIAGLPWHLLIKCEDSERTQRRLHLSVFVYCDNGAKNDWHCHATITFRLLSATGSGQEHELKTQLELYNKHNPSWGFVKFIDVAQLWDASNHWVHNNEATVEAEITAIEVSGGLQRSSFSFYQEDEIFSDVVLIVEDKRLHVNRTLLAMYSPFFRSLFFGDFREAKMVEVPIGDIKYEAMVELLDVIYPSHKAINSLNVESMLALGDRLDIGYVRTECEKYLLETQVISLDKKVELADKYSLGLLRTHCAQSMRSLVDIQRLCASSQLSDLSDRTKSVILDRLLKVLPLPLSPPPLPSVSPPA